MIQFERVKCAEVFRTKHGSYIFFCEYCLAELSDFEVFTEHMVAHVTGALPQDQQNTIDSDNYLFEPLSPFNEPLSPFNKDDYADEMPYLSNESRSNNSASDAELLEVEEEVVDILPAGLTHNLKEFLILNNEDKVTQHHTSHESQNCGFDQTTSALVQGGPQYLNHDNSLITSVIKEDQSNDRIDEGSERSYRSEINDTNNPRFFANQNKRHRCPASYCNSRFYPTMEELETHYQRSHMPVKCDVCQRQFSCLLNMQRHRLNHKRTFECDICHKLFANHAGIKIHMVTHSGYKEFQCNMCNQAFAYNSNRLKHQRWHIGQSGKRYICDICGYLCSTHTKLRDHIKIIHAQIYDQQCSKCDKKFKSVNNLKVHFQRVHTDERPWLCRSCPMTFRNIDTRKAHEKREHL